ncbi:beta-aspartyl-peptidase (threonine type) [Fibrisoma limi BUZ 3]|uniref:Isoaspartyl peptidase n=1 Tax=Fibrisoma limi BUZ 3 TaxID=1185876 RepID=I2GDM6_9BACT|nr:isoaspartyl peptidase/L-asparaginase [Fibrisoma limi]CCH52000.1 beta-aspartyl-peptidase (threonine type) [Fibrisoma limi BUZ 3]
MFVIAVHGGAKSLTSADITPEQEQTYRQGLTVALNAGYDVLVNGGTALEAVEQAVIALENNELFNAGKGAAFTLRETHEMEAAIMDGQTLEAGATTGVRNIRNPIALARTILDKSEHVFLIGDGAETFASEQGLPFESDDYFFSQNSYDELKQELATKSMGTVGAVALDRHGNLAAATSTGGLTGQKSGRVGDSPIVGAGTYANNATCAVSCTGDGEFMIRSVAAYDVSCLIEYGGSSLPEACERVVFNKLKHLGGEGGLIALNRAGEVAMPFNSSCMFRGWRNEAGDGEISVF